MGWRCALNRILLDARPIGDGRHGIARYILSLAPHLAAASVFEWTVVCAPEWEAFFAGLGMRTVWARFRDAAGTVDDSRPLADLLRWADLVVVVTAHRAIDLDAVDVWTYQESVREANGG